MNEESLDDLDVPEGCSPECHARDMKLGEIYSQHEERNKEIAELLSKYNSVAIFGSGVIEVFRYAKKGLYQYSSSDKGSTWNSHSWTRTKRIDRKLVNSGIFYIAALETSWIMDLEIEGITGFGVPILDLMDFPRPHKVRTWSFQLAMRMNFGNQSYSEYSPLEELSGWKRQRIMRKLGKFLSD